MFTKLGESFHSAKLTIVFITAITLLGLLWIAVQPGESASQPHPTHSKDETTPFTTQLQGSGTLSVTVVGIDTGMPLSGTQVDLYQTSILTTAYATASAFANTIPDGYAFTDLPAGDYIVCVWDVGRVNFNSARYVSNCSGSIPAPADETDGTSVTVTDDAVQTVEITLDRGGKLGIYVPEDNLDSTPSVNWEAQGRVVLGITSNRFDSPGVDYLEGETRYIPNIRPGVYELSLFSFPLTGSRSNHGTTKYYGGNTLDSTISITISANTTTAIQLPIVPLNVISGTITTANPAHTITSAEIKLAPVNSLVDREYSREDFSSTSGLSNGRFQIGHVPPGLYRLQVDVKNDPYLLQDGYYTADGTLSFNAADAKVFDFGLGETEEIDIVLTQGDKTGSLSWEFADGLSDGATGEVILKQVFYLREDYILTENPTNNIPVGEYYVYAAITDTTQYYQPSIPLNKVIITEDETANSILKVLPKSSLDLSVVNADNEDVSGTYDLDRVFNRGCEVDDYRLTSFDIGAFDNQPPHVVSGIFPSPYEILIEPSASGDNGKFYADTTASFEIMEDGTPTSLVITVEEGAQIKGVIRGPDGSSPPDADNIGISLVSLLEDGNAQLYEYKPVYSEDNWEYEFNQLPPGQYVILIGRFELPVEGTGSWNNSGSRNGFSYVFYPNSADIENATVFDLTAGSVTDLNIPLSQGTIISATFGVKDGVEVRDSGEDGIRVYAYRLENGEYVPWRYIDASDIRFPFVSRDIPDGTYIFRFGDHINGFIPLYSGGVTDFESATPVVVDGQSSIDLGEFLFDQAPRLRFRLITETGPGNSFWVSLYDSKTRELVAERGGTTFSYGVQEIDVDFYGIPEGEYVAYVQGQNSRAINGIQCGFNTYGDALYYNSGKTFETAERITYSWTNDNQQINIPLRWQAAHPPNTLLYTTTGQISGPVPSRFTLRSSSGVKTLVTNDTAYTLSLPAGEHTIRPRAFGYEFTPESITVNITETVSGLDFTSSRSQADSVISGTVKSLFRVVGTAGLGDVQVTAYADVSGEGEYEVIADTLTDSDGNYQFTGLPAGSYLIKFSDPVGRFQTVFQDGSSSIETATPINLAAGEQATQAELGLTPAATPLATIIGANTYYDAGTGEVTVYVAEGSETSFSAIVPITCEAGPLTNPHLLVGQGSVDLSPFDDGRYQATIAYPSDVSVEDTIRAGFTCAGIDGYFDIGSVEAASRLGQITDRATGDPMSGLTVSLYQVEGALPDIDSDNQRDCRTTETRPATTDTPFGAWSAVPIADNSSGVLVDTSSSFENNWTLTDSDGYFGWELGVGCYYVTIQSEEIGALTSPLFGNTGQVSDLNVVISTEETVYIPLFFEP